MTTEKEFDILESPDYEQFIAAVTRHLNSGWQLHGSLIAFPNHSDEDGQVTAVRYIQAFIKTIPRGNPGLINDEETDIYGEK